MNQKLVAYGIKEEQSDIRAHVSVVGKSVYVYPTRYGINAIERGNYPKAPAKQNGIITAMGFLVPHTAIAQCRTIPIPGKIMAQALFCETDSTSIKGEKAVRVVCWLLRAGLFPLWAQPGLVEEADLQIEGMDILVNLKTRIQVKCDWKCGTNPGCTGNLYIQTEECNPFRLH